MNVANIVLNDFTNDSRVLKTSRSISTLGYNVTIVALHCDGLAENECYDHFCLDRVKLKTRSWSKLKLIQLIKYFEFLIRVFYRYKKFDFVHCNDLEALPIGLLIKLFGSDVKVIYDCHEYQAETNDLDKFSKRMKGFLEWLLIRYVDDVIVVSESIAGEYIRLYNIRNPYLVLNCPTYYEQPKRNLFREKLDVRSDQTIFLYQGGLSKGRGIELLLDAFSDLDTDKSVLVCMGYGPLEGLIQEKAQQQNTVFFHPAVTPEVLLNYTSSADYGILFYEDTCLNHRYCSPNKMFEYLMAGLPVLTSNLFEMKRLVETEGVGIVAEENTVEGFRKALKASLNQDYAAIQKNVFSARKKYCWEEQENVLKEIYNTH